MSTRAEQDLRARPELSVRAARCSADVEGLAHAAAHVRGLSEHEFLVCARHEIEAAERTLSGVQPAHGRGGRSVPSALRRSGVERARTRVAVLGLRRALRALESAPPEVAQASARRIIKTALAAVGSQDVE